jgi:hypothetical protein
MVVDAGVRGAICQTALDDSQAVSVALTAPLVNLQVFDLDLSYAARATLIRLFSFSGT